MIPSSKVFHLRARVLGCGLAAVMVVSIIGASVAPLSASADQISDQKAKAAVLAEKINAEGRQVEVLAEQFNGARLHQTQVEQQLADAQQRFAAAQAQAEKNRQALNQEAMTAYVHGGVVSHPVVSGYRGAADIAVAKGYFNVATGNQVDALDRMRLAAQQLRQQQAALLVAQHDTQMALADVAGRKHAVEQAANASAATLNQVQGDLVAMVADQQAAIAAKQLADAAAALQRRPSLAIAVGAPASTGANAAASPSAAGLAVAVGPALSSGADPSSGATPAPKIVATIGPAPSTTPPTTANPKPPPVKASAGAAAAIAYAQAQLGKPYLWGGAGPASFDCSGLTMRAWGAAGVSLPHSAAAQYSSTAHIPIAQLQPGDLVFFGSGLYHEGIYVGGGSMIHAPHSGAVVSYSTIFWPDLQPFGGRP